MKEVKTRKIKVKVALGKNGGLRPSGVMHHTK